MTLLDDDTIDSALEGLTSWRREGDSIVRDCELADFRAVIAAVNAIAELAEEANHHPDLLVHGYKRLRVELTTHAESAITQADLDLASRIDRAL